MLTELQISQFAIIENQSINFKSGLNVLTGETGSGKSIILDALGLILGGRSSSNLIRTGCDTSEVHAHFDLSNISENIKKTLPDIINDDELVVTRTINTQGRGKVYINGTISTVSVLSEVSSRIINICSQSQQIRLLDSTFHLELLDGFIDNQPLLLEYSQCYQAWQKAKQEYDSMVLTNKEKESRIIWIQDTINELEQVNIQPGIRKVLENTIKTFNDKGKLNKLVSEFEQILRDETGLLSLSDSLSKLSTEIFKIDPKFIQAYDAVKIVKEEIFNIDTFLGKYNLTLNDKVNTDEIETLEDRLSKIARLERKHGTDDSGLSTLLNKCKIELDTISSESGIEALKQKVDKLKDQASKIALNIRAVRYDAGKTLSKLVQRELSELNMKDASFALSWEQIPLGLKGIDSVSFVLSSNKGEALRPLKQIASGGELSRIMLVLKKILRDRSGINVLVFDEVDTGISGSVARAVGQKLKSLSKESQVLCITHLPQVASFADHHLLVEKTPGKRTTTQVRELNEAQRIDEVARMLSGFEVTKASRNSAIELIKTAV